MYLCMYVCMYVCMFMRMFSWVSIWNGFGVSCLLCFLHFNETKLQTYTQMSVVFFDGVGGVCLVRCLKMNR